MATTADRIIELDIDALGGVGSASKAAEIVSRLMPLWKDAIGCGSVAGLVLNLGWLMDPVTLFSGDPGQRLPIRSSRLAAYADLTYRRLGELVAELRQEAFRRGIPTLRIGMLVLGIGEFVNEIVRAPGTGTAGTREAALYQERGEWYARHPELFPFSPAITLHGPGVDWRQPLGADSARYATRPSGIAGGASFAEFFADQWAAVAETVGFDLLLMRDEMTTPVHSGRVGFDGSSNPADSAQVDEWTTALVAVTSTVKQRSPGTFLMLYSSGLSPTVELIYGRLDIARVVAEGEIDAWIDQTWGGAWQDWWDAGWQGWSFQLSNLLARAALIEAGNRHRSEPCRHYPLFQLLDGWEPYDTLHDYPEKLKWGIWAFSHAATRAGETYRPRDGAYLAVANDRTGRLIGSDDVAWVAETVSAAAESASHLERVLGPELVIPGAQAGIYASSTAESVEDAVGFLGKWGAPVLAAIAADLREDQSTEGRVRAAIEADAAGTDGAPTLVVGAPEDLRNYVAALLGVERLDRAAPSGYRRGFTDDHRELSAQSWPYMGRRQATAIVPPAHVIYGGEDGPTAVSAGANIWWLPPHVANGADRRLTHYQIGTVDPHVAVARAFSRLRVDRGLLALDPLPRHETISLHGWVSAGVLHVLIGNVESGWIGDSRYPRRVLVRLPEEFLTGFENPHLVVADGPPVPVCGTAVSVRVPAEGFALGRVVDLETSGAAAAAFTIDPEMT
ncbi:hypothetical protein [uncultured Microbacterium sp.]|uniref:hypothetical protein n=1 Tax=uncultured Microbacterium sp. TaxID=191216 RepID=UPI0035C96ACD